MDYFIPQFRACEDIDYYDALIIRESSYNLNLGEIIINHGDHSVIDVVNNNFQNKTSATKKKRSKNQNRQQQRSKKVNKINPVRALELQNLFK